MLAPTTHTDVHIKYDQLKVLKFLLQAQLGLAPYILP
jgi:hypothetical protein